MKSLFGPPATARHSECPVSPSATYAGTYDALLFAGCSRFFRSSASDQSTGHSPWRNQFHTYRAVNMILPTGSVLTTSSFRNTGGIQSDGHGSVRNTTKQAFGSLTVLANENRYCQVRLL